MPDGTVLAADAELLEVLAPWAQVVHLDVHGVRQVGGGMGYSVGNDVP